MLTLKQFLTAAVVGVGIGWSYKNILGGKLPFGAEGDASTEGETASPTLFDRIRSAVRGVRPSELEELSIERTGTTFDVQPQSFDPAFVGSYELTQQTASRTLNMSPYGTGVIDYEVRSAEAYGTTLSSEDFQVNSVGQEAMPSNQVPMAYTYPQMLGSPCRLENNFGIPQGAYQERPGYPSNRQGDFTRLSTVYMTTDTLSPDMNVSFTDGMQTMSFEEWRRNYNLTPVSDTTFQAISKNGGPRLMIRRL